MHEPRFKAGLGVGYAISPTGADHCHNIHDSMFTVRMSGAMRGMGIFDPLPSQELSPAKVRLLLYGSLWQHVLNCLVFCTFVPMSADNIVDLMKVVNGWNTNLFELMKAGERCVTMARMFNIREGKSKADDFLPKRFLTPFSSGPLKDVAIKESELAQSIETYYGMVGWDKNGIPAPAKLAELGIEWVARA